MIAGLRQAKSLALIVSVGLNLFFVGLVVGGHSFSFWHRSPYREDIRARLRDSLSQQGASTVTHALDQVRQQFGERFKGAEAGRQRKSELLAKDPFDRNGFLAETRSERAEFTSGIAKADEIVADALAQLSPEDRHKLATMELPPPFGGPRPPPRH
jgi:uncharacterized membrane protein